MISFQRGDIHFNYRVVGVASHHGCILVHRAETENFWSLPGGRGELLEPAEETLKREMREELNAQVGVGRLLWVVENFFEYANFPYHEIALYFEMTLTEESPLLTRAEPFDGYESSLRLIFQWYPLTQLEKLLLYPSFLRRGLNELPATTQHVVHRDVGENV
jgi:ADP-ribose pyrophosphatase YjhB (NUDIX family)